MANEGEQYAVLQSAREAMSRHDWADAMARFVEADRDLELSAGDVRDWAWSAWFSGEVLELPKLLERSFAKYQADGEPAQAALVAMDLARYHGDDPRRQALAFGWLRRAERLLADVPESVAHGMLEVLWGFLAQMDGRFEDALAHAERAWEIGRRFGDRDIEALALNRKGRILIKLGRVSEGNALMDEAMIGAVGDELSTLVTGIVYCSTIDGCADVADYGRAGEWTAAAERFCKSRALNGFPGICRVHRAELLRVHGDLPAAQEEARRACEELEAYGMVLVAGAGHNELGEIHLRRGDLAAAEAAFLLADQMGRSPEPGLSLLRLEQGHTTAALASIRRALDERTGRLARTRFLPPAVEIALAAGDLELAQAASAELRESADLYGTDTLQGIARVARGRVLLAQGDPPGASTALRAGLRLLQREDLPFEVAKARLALGEAYRAEGDEVNAAAELRKARVTFERLQAHLYVQRAVAALGAGSPGAGAREARTFMFTDIVESTTLVAAMGDDAWSQVMRWHDETLRAAIAEHHGEEIKHTGDGFHVAFDDPGAAVGCAIAIQQRLTGHRRSHGFAPRVRIGIHATEATRTGKDYAGVGVHEAARIAGAAGGDQILASWSTLAPLDFPVQGPREVALKGLSEPVQVGEIDWRRC